MDADAIEDRVRAICTALPGVTEKLSHGAPAFCEDAFRTVAPAKLVLGLRRSSGR